jgi:hypothetical protein
LDKERQELVRRRLRDMIEIERGRTLSALIDGRRLF